jgi:hypothetical protein
METDKLLKTEVNVIALINCQLKVTNENDCINIGQTMR